MEWMSALRNILLVLVVLIRQLESGTINKRLLIFVKHSKMKPSVWLFIHQDSTLLLDLQIKWEWWTFSRRVWKHSKKFQLKVAEKLDSQMEVIYLLAQINIISVFINSTQLNAHQSSIIKHILVKLDAFNGLMMTLISFQEVGMEVSLCGDFMQTRIQQEKVNKKKETQFTNLN